MRHNNVIDRQQIIYGIGYIVEEDYEYGHLVFPDGYRACQDKYPRG